MVQIRVLFVSDDSLWQESITKFLHTHRDICVVKVVATQTEALAICLSSVDVVLLDVGSTTLKGMEIANHYFNQGFENIVVLTPFDEERMITQAFECGAINCITKSFYVHISDVVRDTFYGKVTLCPEISKLMVSAYRSECRLKVLTPIERKVFDLHEEGLSRMEISKVLSKSMETVKRQIRSIRHKLQT